jgi:hypothetical protein
MYDRGLLSALVIRNENVFCASSFDTGIVGHSCGFQPDPNGGKTRNQ